MTIVALVQPTAALYGSTAPAAYWASEDVNCLNLADGQFLQFNSQPWPRRYPCTADVGIGICLMGVNGQIVAGMRHKWLIALLFGWSHIMIEHAVYLWLFEGSSGYNYYYFNSLLGCMAQVGMITTSFGSALHIEAKQDSEATKKRT